MFVILAITAVLTAFYMIRMWKLVFLGEPRSDEARHAHESGPSMTVPLVVLAILAVVGGYGVVYGKLAGDYLALVPHAHGREHIVVLVTSVAVLVVGALAAYRYYPSLDRDALAARSPGVFASLKLLNESFDGIYGYYIQKVQQRFAMLLNFLEQIFLSGLAVRGLAWVVGLFGMGARALHVGSVSAYAYWFLIGLVFLWVFAGGWF